MGVNNPTRDIWERDRQRQRGRERGEHIWTRIRTAKEAKKGGGDRRIGLVMATGVCGGVGVGRGQHFSFLSYLKEAWGHGSSWHAVIGGHVAHHWTGGSGRTLENTRNNQRHSVLCLVERHAICVTATLYYPTLALRMT